MNILGIGFTKKQQKFIQDTLANNKSIIFEKTKKSIKYLIKKEITDLILVNYKTEELQNIIEFLIKHKINNYIEVWLYTTIDTKNILNAYKYGIDDFVGDNWSAEIINTKIDHYYKKNKKYKEKAYKKIKLNSLVINPKKYKVTKKGKELDLTKIEFELLRLLVSDRKKIFTRKEIYKQIWGENIIVGERTLDVHMNNLRKKIGKNFIITKKGIGFGINPEI